LIVYNEASAVTSKTRDLAIIDIPLLGRPPVPSTLLGTGLLVGVAEPNLLG